MPELTRVDKRDEDAINEYADTSVHLSVFCSMEALEKQYGPDIVIYFKFIIFITLSNLILFFLGLISTISFMSDQGSSFEASSGFFVSQYTHKQREAWRASSVLAIIASFLFAAAWHRYTRSTRDIRDIDDSGEDIIEANIRVPSHSRYLRRIVSIICFCLVLGCSMAIAYGFAEAQYITEHNPDQAAIQGFSFVVSMGISFTNFMMFHVARYLTDFEKRTTHTAVRNYNALKLIILRVVNVWMFLLAKFLVQKKRRGNATADTVCYLDFVGRQYFSLIILELTVSNIIEVGVPILGRRIRAKYSKGADIASRGEFDVSVEYLELVYRQYIVYVAFNSFPMISFLAIITNIVEFYLDRFRLIHLMKVTGRMQAHRMTQFLVFFLTLVALLALLSFPSGSAFTINAHQSDYDGFWANCDVMPK